MKVRNYLDNYVNAFYTLKGASENEDSENVVGLNKNNVQGLTAKKNSVTLNGTRQRKAPVRVLSLDPKRVDEFVEGNFVTQDHKPDSAEERARIEGHGGSVEYLHNHQVNSFRIVVS